MVRITGPRREEKLANRPTGDALSSVVRRSRGNKAKRMSGTDSSAPTKIEPSPSNPPRKERLLSRDNPDGEELPVVVSECSASSNMQPLSYHDLHHRQSHGVGFQSRCRCSSDYFFGGFRMDAISFRISSRLILAPKAGIFPLPFAITSLSAASFCF